MRMPEAIVRQLDTLRWRANRLRCMSSTEVAFRIGRAIKTEAQRIRMGIGMGVCTATVRRAPPPDFKQAGATWLRVPAGIDAAPYLAAAERIAAGRLDIL